jgi:large subunit ribosomal protein L16
LISLSSGKITNFQIESLRRFLRRFLKKKAQIFFRIFPNSPITKKPNDVRQGRGKGNIAYWSYIVGKDDIILEIRGSDSILTRNVLSKVRVKLGIKTHVSDLQKR